MPGIMILLQTVIVLVATGGTSQLQYLLLGYNFSFTTPSTSTVTEIRRTHGYRHKSNRSFSTSDANLTCLPISVLSQENAHLPGLQKVTISTTIVLSKKMDIDNTTCITPAHAPKLTTSTIVRVVVLSLIAMVSLIGNVAVLISIRLSNTQRRSTVYFLIGHLALADLFVTQFCVVAEAAWTYTIQWLAGSLICKMIKFLQMFSLYLSTFLLVVIGYDRFMAIRYPMTRVNAKKRVTRMIAGSWIFSVLFSSPQVFVFRVVRGPFVEEFYQCVTYGFYTADWQEQLYTTVSFVLMFLLPLCILMFTYISTFYTIAKKEHRFSDRPKSIMDEARRKLLRKAKMKALMITVVIVMAFVICWTPYYCMMIIFIFLEPDEQLSNELQAAIFFFGSSTAMINPLIYGAFHLRKRPVRTKAHNSSGSSKVENTVMLVTFRKSRVNIHQTLCDTNVLHPNNGQIEKSFHRDISCNLDARYHRDNKLRNSC